MPFASEKYLKATKKATKAFVKSNTPPELKSLKEREKRRGPLLRIWGKLRKKI